MKRLLLLLLPLSVNAAPFVSSDTITDNEITHCAVSLNGSPFVDSALVSSKCHFDVQETATLLPGSHSVDVKLVKNDPLWGRLESAAVNFTFSKPAVPTAPSGLGLVAE